MTYEQFHRRVCRAANALLMLGAGYQERVAVIGPNSVSYAEVIFACAKSGRIVEMINWRLSHEKICRILAESDAKVVMISMSCAKTLDYLQEHLPRQVKYVLLDGENGAALSYEQLLAAQKDTFQDKSCSGDEIVFQLYTSGTTGREKGVMITHIRIVDVDGKPCSAGDVGEIVVHQPTLMKGYYNRPELTEQAIRDGWYYTGDIGFLDEKGFLHLLDRRSSMVISGGENIFPKEVEDCILKYLPDRISELAVIGVPDQTWGEVLMLAVVVEKGACLTEEDIYDVCRAHLDSFKKPRHIYFMDHIPRNEAGKVARQKLLEYHEAQIQNQNK